MSGAEKVIGLYILPLCARCFASFKLVFGPIRRSTAALYWNLSILM